MNAMRQMPKYKCHKEVYALKIKTITYAPPIDRGEDCESDPESGGAIITPADPDYGPFEVDAQYLRRHKPEVGGYYVVYFDGYKSFSPAKAFEDGYTRV